MVYTYCLLMLPTLAGSDFFLWFLRISRTLSQMFVSRPLSVTLGIIEYLLDFEIFYHFFQPSFCVYFSCLILLIFSDSSSLSFILFLLLQKKGCALTSKNDQFPTVIFLASFSSVQLFFIDTKYQE